MRPVNASCFNTCPNERLRPTLTAPFGHACGDALVDAAVRWGCRKRCVTWRGLGFGVWGFSQKGEKRAPPASHPGGARNTHPLFNKGEVFLHYEACSNPSGAA